MTKTLDTFGKRVKFARITSNLSQLELATKIGVSQGTITHIENGRNKESKHIIELAKALAVRAEWLYYGHGNIRDTWPHKTISQSEYEQLNEQAKEEIEDYIKLKLSRSTNLK